MPIHESNGHITADILVVGGGISGITAAIEASEMGKTVVLAEKEAFLGGRVARMHQYFPKLCPPLCGLEINYRRLRSNESVKVMTLTSVGEISGQPGDYEIKLNMQPRFINEHCTACGDCEKACSMEVSDEYNYGMGRRKAVYMPYMAYPPIYAADASAVKESAFKAAVDACKYDAFDLNMPPKMITVKASSIIWATGWKPYDAARIDYLGFGKFANVITNVMLERLAAQDGPTGGKILRPSDGAAPGKVVFVQCAGSRDENHLPYCSAVCCAASIKHANYLRAQYPDAEIHLYYIDVRTPGRLEDFYVLAGQDPKMVFHRGKVAEVREVSGSKNLIVAAENTLTGVITEMEADLVVLATGMVPNTAEIKPPLDTPLDEWGFILPGAPSGIVGAGVASRPFDVAASVQDASGAVIRALLTQGRI
jgi:quinone-modifying oxidoreductase subunit QmoA